MLVIYPSSYASFKKFNFFVVFKLGQIFRVLHLRPYLKYPIFLSSLKCHINHRFLQISDGIQAIRVIGSMHQMMDKTPFLYHRSDSPNDSN